MSNRRLWEALHITVLAFWLGALVLTAVAAFIVFPEMRRLDPSLPGYERYTGEHWSIAGGHIAGPLIDACTLVQSIAAALAAATLGLALRAQARVSGRGERRRTWTFVRAAVIAVPILSLGYQALVLGPPMDRDLRLYWDAARAGENQAAAAHKAAFYENHTAGSALFAVNALAVCVALAAGMRSLAAREP